MALYPLPVVIAALGWIFILVSSGAGYILAGFGFIALTVAAFLYRSHKHGEWPFLTTKSVSQ